MGIEPMTFRTLVGCYLPTSFMLDFFTVGFNVVYKISLLLSITTENTL